jgi:hypothetical protein
MNRSTFFVLAGILILQPTLSPAQGLVKTTISQFGWTIVADPPSGLISVSHEKLGAVMENLKLNLVDGLGIHPLSGWSVNASSPTRLSIRTGDPTTGWQFDVESDFLKVSSTGEGATLTADLPASPDRIPARLLDPQGVPVTWSGTTEVQGNYGGAVTSNSSMLPSRNPECMYFRLGQIASPLFHDLFDRSSDTAIAFPERSRMWRDPLHPDVMKLELPLQGSAVIRLTPDYYTKVLGLPHYRRFDDSEFKAAPLVWSSWTSYYENVREEDIVRNTDWIAAHLLPYGFQYVELDDGYDRGEDGEHYWIENWDASKFPHGASWLTDYIKSKGLRPGVWLVPNAYAGAIKDHPAWYVRDRTGKPVLDYATPALDSTNPEVLDFVQSMFRKLDDMGFEYYKLDGEHAFPLYVPAVDRSRLHDKSVDLVDNYRHRLDLIRQVIGPRRFLEACPAGTPLNGIGYVNSYFNGEDMYASWQGMYPLFSSINANAFFNHIAAYTMPGEGLELGPPMTVDETSRKRNPAVLEIARIREDPVVGFGVTQAEARTLVTYIALTGVAYPLASVMPELPEDRVRLLQATMPTLPIFPVDLFSRGTEAGWQTFRSTNPDVYIHNYPEVLDLKVNSIAGVYDVVALTNWRSTGANREIDLGEKLGLDSRSKYLVFDFWNRKLLGVIGASLSVHIDPHDTRVLSIHPLQGRPQLVGLSRHISGSYSLLDQSWDSSTNTLSGTSESVPGDPYALWIYVPEGYRLAQARAVAGQSGVPIEKQLDRSSLMIRFTGVKEHVHWEVQFERQH